MRIVLFLDLDDTILQTQPKCPAGEAVRPVGFGKDGKPLSFMTERQRTLLDKLFSSATIIPTTARNYDAFRRIDLVFQGPVILDFGGVVLLPERKLDPVWDARIRPRAQEVGPALHKFQEAIARFIAGEKLGAIARVIADFDMPLYVVVKHPQGDCAKLKPIQEELHRLADPDQYFLHGNDNNLSLVPRFLGKERAVQHVLQNHFGSEPVLTVGLGDSFTDGPFLDLCDFSMMPRGCQLSQNWSHLSRES
jgi:hypothetical protein